MNERKEMKVKKRGAMFALEVIRYCALRFWWSVGLRLGIVKRRHLFLTYEGLLNQFSIFLLLFNKAMRDENDGDC